MPGSSGVCNVEAFLEIIVVNNTGPLYGVACGVQDSSAHIVGNLEKTNGLVLFWVRMPASIWESFFSEHFLQNPFWLWESQDLNLRLLIKKHESYVHAELPHP